MDESCSQVNSFFDHGSDLFILSIRHGHMDVADIAAQLQANPRHVKTFFQWMNGTIGNGIVRALMAWDVNHHVTNRDRQEVVVAVYTVALLYNYQSVTYQLPILYRQQAFIDYIEQFDSSLDYNFLIKACKEGNFHLVRHLSTLPTINASAQENYAIQCASLYGHLDVVQFLSTLIEVDVSDDDNTAIQWASASGHLDVVQFLSNLPSVDASAKNNVAIRRASYNGHLEVVQFLSKLRGVDASADNNEAIQCASYKGYLAVVQFLSTLPQVIIPIEQAEIMWAYVQDDDIKRFWKLYITSLNQRKEAEQGMEQHTKIKKARIHF